MKTKKPYSLAEQLELNQSDIYPGLLPWEPLITGNRDYMTSQYIADEGTKCEACGQPFTAGDPIVHGCGVDCCSWECAIEYGKNHLYVHNIGIY